MKKSVFTAPEIADVCSVSRQTVNRWLNTRELRGYRTTKNSDWRILRKELILFFKNNNIPIDLLKDEKIKILVIDDEIEVTSLIKQVFWEEEDFEVEVANSGFSAGVKLASFKPDVIVLDIILGDMDGREFFKHLHEDHEYSNTKVIGISGKIDSSEIQPLLKSGFDAFLQKPLELKKLKNLIVSLVCC